VFRDSSGAYSPWLIRAGASGPEEKPGSPSQMIPSRPGLPRTARERLRARSRPPRTSSGFGPSALSILPNMGNSEFNRTASRIPWNPTVQLAYPRFLRNLPIQYAHKTPPAAGRKRRPHGDLTVATRETRERETTGRCISYLVFKLEAQKSEGHTSACPSLQRA
jgi:hypothetical protein